MGIGRKLTDLMKKRNTNANELAALTGVPAQTIYSLIRRDANKVDIDSLIRIARALGVTADYFGNDESSDNITIAAHRNSETDNWTADELQKIEDYKKLLLAARVLQNKGDD